MVSLQKVTAIACLINLGNPHSHSKVHISDMIMLFVFLQVSNKLFFSNSVIRIVQCQNCAQFSQIRGTMYRHLFSSSFPFLSHTRLLQRDFQKNTEYHHHSPFYLYKKKHQARLVPTEVLIPGVRLIKILCSPLK